MDNTLGFSSSRSVGSKCGRWNPTVEQVKVLTDLFRSGLRTPSTDQIQLISAHLSAYGKIESKNVFYWFQNHKARERHGHRKRRRGDRDDHQEQHEDEGVEHHSHRARTTSLAYCAKGSEHESTFFIQERDDLDRDLGDQTLELFPLKSYNYSLSSAEHCSCKGGATAATFFDTNRDHLPLDLRLSFL